MAPPSSGWVAVPMWALACMYTPRVTMFMFEHAMRMFEHAMRMGRQAAVADFRSQQVW